MASYGTPLSAVPWGYYTLLMGRMCLSNKPVATLKAPPYPSRLLTEPPQTLLLLLEPLCPARGPKPSSTPLFPLSDFIPKCKSVIYVFLCNFWVSFHSLLP